MLTVKFFFTSMSLSSEFRLAETILGSDWDVSTDYCIVVSFTYISNYECLVNPITESDSNSASKM